MRRKPVTRSEIRFNGRYISALSMLCAKRILGASCRSATCGAPLLHSLTQCDAQWGQFFNAIGPPQTPEPVRLPDRYVWPEPRLCYCQHCGREFYRVGGSGRYCPDVCTEASWRASRAVRDNAAALADRRCTRCDEPITAQRSDGKFCSVRCRVAAHRAHLKASQGS